MADEDPTHPRPLPVGAVNPSSTFDIPGHRVDEHLGVIFGLVVRSTGFVDPDGSRHDVPDA